MQQRCMTELHVCRLKIVDFGSGSGNLILPLAYMFQDCDFTAVDMKAEAIKLLRERAAEAGLANITAEVGRMEDYRFGPHRAGWLDRVPLCGTLCHIA